MGLGKVIGWGIAFVFLLGVTITGFAETAAMAQSGVSIPGLVALVGGATIWAIITYFVGRKFIRAIKEYRAKKPLQ
jgi:hypothetical protein